MSAVKEAPQTGVPPMINQQQEQAHEASEPEVTAMPGFMQSSRSASPQPEPVQLISASDLPDWIKQIAAADEAKAAAEVAAANPVVPAATIAHRPLPGETHVSGPSTNWLSKSSATSAEPSEPWGAAEAASANWGNQHAAGGEAHSPTVTSLPTAPVFVPSGAADYSYPKPKSWLSRPSRTTSSTSSTPLYRRQAVQIAALLALLAVFALILF